MSHRFTKQFSFLISGSKRSMAQVRLQDMKLGKESEPAVVFVSREFLKREKERGGGGDKVQDAFAGDSLCQMFCLCFWWNSWLRARLCVCLCMCVCVCVCVCVSCQHHSTSLTVASASDGCDKGSLILKDKDLGRSLVLQSVFAKITTHTSKQRIAVSLNGKR